MADAYWRYNQPASNIPPSLPYKRPRSDYDIPGGHELPGYFPRDDGRAGHHVTRDSDTIGASYDRYLRSGQISSYGGGESGRSLSGAMGGYPDDLRISSVGGMDAAAGKGQSFAIGSGKPALPLPPDASNTLFVEGLPANCTRREVSHIFRPFVGFKEVRLVNKEARHSGDDPLVLCFVDFSTPAEAATALDALQGNCSNLDHNITNIHLATSSTSLVSSPHHCRRQDSSRDRDGYYHISRRLLIISWNTLRCPPTILGFLQHGF